MRYRLALTLLAAAALAAPAQEVPDAAAVVRKAVAAHGGEAALKALAVSSSAASGTMTVLGTEYAVASEVLFAAPDKLRMTLKTETNGQKLELVQVVNGDRFAATTNGQAGKQTDAEKAELRQALSMMDLTTVTPLLTDKYTLKALPDEKLGDLDTRVLTATPTAKGADPRPVTLSFDAKSGYLVRYVREALAPAAKGGFAKVQEETRLSDFKKFDGAMVATKAVVTHGGKPFMTVTVSAVKALPAIDPKQFAVTP